MSKRTRREKTEKKAGETGKTSSTSAVETIRRRRNKRLLMVGAIAILMPLFELVAYQFRATTITFVNSSTEPIKGLKLTYPGGAFDAPEIKAGARLTHVIRPNYTFHRDDFSTYRLMVSFATPDGGFYRQTDRIGSLDYSARETFTLFLTPPKGAIELKHTTTPGFPLGTIRDLLASMGIG